MKEHSWCGQVMISRLGQSGEMQERPAGVGIPDEPVCRLVECKSKTIVGRLQKPSGEVGGIQEHTCCGQTEKAVR
jgi:hypothetical protein